MPRLPGTRLRTMVAKHGIGRQLRSPVDFWGLAIAARGKVTGWWQLEIARRRLFNWLPVFMGLGVLLYFAADREPGLIAPLSGFAIAAVAACLSGRWQALQRAAIIAACVFAGFASAVWRTASVNAPIIERARIATLTGFVESVEKRNGGARIVVRPTAFADLAADSLPSRVRVTARSSSLNPGDHVSATARLLPPPEPARPGGYDFARDAFFRGVGAVGSLSGAIKLVPTDIQPPRGLWFDVAIDKARNTLTERIISTIGGQAGAVAAALVTGKRGQISEQTNDALRAAGIYHVVSISGLHMVLAAGTIFWLVRALLALSVTIALTWPVKKIAAVFAMAGATAYCIFSGSDVATERSLIMTLVMLGAILVDRPALSMRNLAISAIIVLLREPETMLGPSFQMSFGAVAALIAYAERIREKQPAPPAQGFLGRAMRMVKFAIIGDLVTTLLATAATAPFGVFHFQTVNPYGLIGNAMALPFISLVVMPGAVAGVLLYPFGLDSIAWWAMGVATWPVLAMSAAIAAHAGSTTMVPAFAPIALLCLALALVWLTLWTTPLRFAALLPLGAGLAMASMPTRIDAIIDRSGAGAAIRTADGRLAILGKPSGFTIAQWLAADGDTRKPADPSLIAASACDRQGCVLKDANNNAVSFARTRRAIAEDCTRASLVITPLVWRGPCAAQLIDRQVLDKGGALVLQRRPHVPGMENVWDMRAARMTGERPWVQKSWKPPAYAGQAVNAPLPTAAPRIPFNSPAGAPEPDSEPAASDIQPDARDGDDLRVQ
jgi:competence protein ComEC